MINSNTPLPDFVYACSLANPARLNLVVMNEGIVLKIEIILLMSSTTGFSSRVMAITFYFPLLFEWNISNTVFESQRACSEWI